MASVRLDDETHRKLKVLAEAHGVSQVAMVRQLVAMHHLILLTASATKFIRSLRGTR